MAEQGSPTGDVIEGIDDGRKTFDLGGS